MLNFIIGAVFLIILFLFCWGIGKIVNKYLIKTAEKTVPQIMLGFATMCFILVLFLFITKVGETLKPALGIILK
jgi:drug/metabolite transporter (DMT)-like permease